MNKHLFIVKNDQFEKTLANKSYLGLNFETLIPTKLNIDSYEFVDNKDIIVALKQSAFDINIVVDILRPDFDLIKFNNALDILINGSELFLKLNCGYLFKKEVTDTILNDAFNNVSGKVLFNVIYEVNSNLSLNNPNELNDILDNIRKSIVFRHMSNGVFFIDINTVYIDNGVKIGKNTTVYPNNHLRGNTVIGEDCTIDINCIIENSIIGNKVSILSSVLNDVQVNSFTTVGPFAYLRNKAVVGEHCRVGDYVEIKDSKLGNGTKVAHLTYIGDATVGEGCNVGCGVVFANYDGTNKFKTVIGNHVFIGSNCNIIAPRIINDGVYIAAGTTISTDLPADSFVIGRAREVIKENRPNKFNKKEKTE